MSIATEITRLQTAKADLKTAIEGKGVTVPSATKLDGYADLVDTISQGSTPTGTKQISVTQNGTQTENVSGYASAQLNVAVPNSYSQSDEGKVVSNGALVAQTAHADVTPTTSDQTIDTTTNDSIKVKGDADLVASNIKKDVEIFGVTGSYEGGGGGISIDDLATNTAPSGAVTLGNSVTEIKEYAFAGKPITAITAPSVTKIGQNSLQNTQITDITDANFPVLGVSSNYAVLLRVSSLQHIKLSGRKIMLSSGSYALRENTNLVTAEFPHAAEDVGESHVGMGMYAFAGNTKLELVDAGSVASVSHYAFYNSNKLGTIILRNTSLVSLNNVSAFTNTPFKNGGTGGHIYIPKTLYDALGTGTNDYKAASNWSTVDGYGTITWHAIEGSQYEL